MKKIYRFLSMLLAVFLISSSSLTVFAYESQNTKISATVKKVAPAEYSVTYPQTISFGKITPGEPAEATFTVKVTMTGNSGTLRIEAPKTGTFYLNGEDTSCSVEFSNNFGTQDFTQTKTVEGKLTVPADQTKNVKAGSYSGSISFVSTFYDEDEELPAIEDEDSDADDDSHDEDQDEDSSEETSATKAVGIYKYTSNGISTTPSMCDQFFYENAKLESDGNGNTKVTLYCIDPIPDFSDQSQPIGSMTVNSDYAATITSKNTTKYFETGSLIAKAGNYQADTITFTIPSESIRNSKSGGVLAEFYIQVMKTTEKAYIVFDDATDWDDSTFEAGSFSNTSTVNGTTVAGADEYAAANKAAGEFSLEVSSADTTSSSEQISKLTNYLYAQRYKGTDSFYDITFTSTSSAGKESEIEDTGNYVLEIGIPFSYDSTQQVTVYRVHGDDNDVQAFQSVSARESSGNYLDGTFYFDTSAKKIYIYSNKFSLYDIHQEPVTQTTSTSSTTSTTSSTSTTTSSDDGTWSATVEMRKADDSSTTSMCNGLFYDGADITVSGDSATVTIYVIDPIPNYSEDGTPLEDVKVTTSSGTVSATISSSQVAKAFAMDANFISEAGNYYTDPITFTIPWSAVEDSEEKLETVLISAYVSAEMKSTQEFYALFTDLEKGSSTATASGTVKSTSSKKTTTTSDGTETDLKNGSYKVKVGALKTNSSEASMMEQYMYEYGDLVVSDSGCKLTVYVQHTVAGKENGGPEYMSYEGTKATKTTNAKTVNGVVYDGFTISADNPISDILTVQMHINAMNMDVSCRLTLDLDNLSTTEGTSSKTASTTSSGGLASSSKSSTNSVGTETDISDDQTPLSGENQNSVFSRLTAKSIAIIVICCIIGALILGFAGYYLYLIYKKRNI